MCICVSVYLYMRICVYVFYVINYINNKTCLWQVVGWTIVLNLFCLHLELDTEGPCARPRMRATGCR